MKISTDKARQFAEFIGHVSEGTGGRVCKVWEDCLALIRLEEKLTSLNEFECNSPDFGEREELYRGKLQAKAEKIVADLSGEMSPALRCEFNNDPRGSAIRIHFPDGRYNSWGGMESGIYVP